MSSLTKGCRWEGHRDQDWMACSIVSVRKKNMLTGRWSVHLRFHLSCSVYTGVAIDANLKYRCLGLLTMYLLPCFHCLIKFISELSTRQSRTEYTSSHFLSIEEWLCDYILISHIQVEMSWHSFQDGPLYIVWLCPFLLFLHFLFPIGWSPSSNLGNRSLLYCSKIEV